MKKKNHNIYPNKTYESQKKKEKIAPIERHGSVVKETLSVTHRTQILEFSSSLAQNGIPVHIV